MEQDLSGPFAGRALLIFPRTEASSSFVWSRRTSQVSTTTETLGEIGNIVINGCLGELANVLKVSLELSLPLVVEEAALNCSRHEDSAGKNLSLFIHVNFSLKEAAFAATSLCSWICQRSIILDSRLGPSSTRR